MGNSRPIDAAKYELRMAVLPARGVEGKSLKEISEEFDVPERTLQRWLTDVPRVRLGR